MIAYDSRGIPENARGLSRSLAQRLRDAMAERWRAAEGPDAERATRALAAALVEAATEARERTLRPEELVIAIKRLEREVAAEDAGLTPGERSALRAWLVSACIRAYFRAP